MAACFVATDLKNEGIAGSTVDGDLRLCTRGPTRPTWSRFNPWLLVGWWTREVDFVRSPTAKRVIRAMLIVPIDNETNLTFEMRLFLVWRDQPKNLLERSMEAFDYGHAAVLADGTEPRQDVHGFTPDILEVNAVEFGSLIDNQMFRLYLLSNHDAIQGCCHFLRRGPALEYGESHGPP